MHTQESVGEAALKSELKRVYYPDQQRTYGMSGSSSSSKGMGEPRREETRHLDSKLGRADGVHICAWLSRHLQLLAQAEADSGLQAQARVSATHIFQGLLANGATRIRAEVMPKYKDYLEREERAELRRTNRERALAGEFGEEGADTVYLDHYTAPFFHAFLRTQGTKVSSWSKTRLVKEVVDRFSVEEFDTFILQHELTNTRRAEDIYRGLMAAARTSVQQRAHQVELDAEAGQIDARELSQQESGEVREALEESTVRVLSQQSAHHSQQGT
jgi:hypothetical protein